MTLIRVILAAACLALASGCSVVMAAKQPPKKDLSLLKPGVPRMLLVAEFGGPAYSETGKDGKRVDVFSFNEGYSKGAKVSRSVFHGLADVATLGLWEVVGTPTEAVFDGKDTVVSVTYDERDIVEKATVLKRK